MIDTLSRNGPHENILTILRHRWLNPQYYYIDMELCEQTLEVYILGHDVGSFSLWHEYVYLHSGQSWHELEKGKLWMLWSIMVEISNGLQFIHGCGLVHGNLNPKTGIIFLNKTYEVFFSPTHLNWVIGEFNSPRTSTDDVTRIPPEMRKGQCDCEADIWALGCILFEVAAGRSLIAQELDKISRTRIMTELETGFLVDDYPTRHICQMIQVCFIPDAHLPKHCTRCSRL